MSKLKTEKAAYGETAGTGRLVQLAGGVQAMLVAISVWGFISEGGNIALAIMAIGASIAAAIVLILQGKKIESSQQSVNDKKNAIKKSVAISVVASLLTLSWATTFMYVCLIAHLIYRHRKLAN